MDMIVQLILSGANISSSWEGVSSGGGDSLGGGREDFQKNPDSWGYGASAGSGRGDGSGQSIHVSFLDMHLNGFWLPRTHAKISFQVNEGRLRMEEAAKAQPT